MLFVFLRLDMARDVEAGVRAVLHFGGHLLYHLGLLVDRIPEHLHLVL
jgi:hypothetical protein